MATMKKNNKRKFAAVALALVGVAGLSVASAATLTVDAGNEVAIGVDEFAACDTDGVAVDYTYTDNGTSYVIDDLTVSGIAAGCANEGIEVVLEDSSGAELVTVSATTIGSTTFTQNIANEAIAIGTDLGDVTVIIG